MNIVLLAFLLSLLGYTGILVRQLRWFQQGTLTEARFIFLQLPLWSLLAITGALAISNNATGIAVGIALAILSWAIGYPVARWIHRKNFFAKH